MTPPAPAASAPKVPAKAQVKETLISLIIAFVMAFVFRAFVIEAFIIPTGSMAPTLLGAHMDGVSPNTGYRWTMNPDPRYQTPGPNGLPLSVQGSPGNPLRRHDPMSKEELQYVLPTHAGDRILVFKYLYSVYDPRRWDVVVFKAPHDPQTNYIKRLVGLPGEMPAIIDGDVFVRRPAPGETLTAADNPWLLGGWQIQRKPERVQRSVWQDVYWSQYQPLDDTKTDELATALQNRRVKFASPWVGSGAGWAIEKRQSYEFSGAGPAALAWDSTRRPVRDFYAYNEATAQNEAPIQGGQIFPVSDVNMAATVEARGAAPLRAAAIVRTRGHEFRADIDGTTVILRAGALGPAGANGAPGPATLAEIGRGELAHPLSPGTMTALEFWHVDQSLQLWADGHLVAHAEYDWTPDERLRFALGKTAAEVFEDDRRLPGPPGSLGNPALYHQPELRWEFEGGPFTLHRVGLQRDLHYQAGYRTDARSPARQTSPVSTFLLGKDHFFVCGDNNPASLDARLWGDPDAWVAKQIDGTSGIVPRDLMIGRAFFVYFPSLIRGQWGLPVPDFGHMRWIW